MSAVKTGNPAGDHNMPGFMTALYGAIVGVNLSRIEFNWDLIWQPHTIAAIELRFQFFLLIFSLVIVAHDWFIFHREKWFVGKSFAAYSFQLGYLLCLCMMLVLCKYNTIMEWYIAALAYTCFNIIERIRLDKITKKQPGKKINQQKYLKYIVHLGMVIGILVFCPPNTPERMWRWSIALMITVILVVAMWMLTDNLDDEQEVVAIKDNLSITINGKPVLLTYEAGTEDLKDLEKIKIWYLMKASLDTDLTAYYKSLFQKDPSSSKIHLLKTEQEKWKKAFEEKKPEEMAELEAAVLSGIKSIKL